ncbi:tRNA pseudouridine synthase-like 1 [Episyrphus balteatus]|uniref:tRNA pseudouridine synthase-like 1 n=1 Tax=Episyrphus balteatus TaxID=286459 RepID=UPI002485C867|nr:tRNA pseudouridine synthase-like 1 [Episyrphus balteatus]
MNRYLLNISYIGTRFSGIQKVVYKGVPRIDTSTIQGCLELALKVFRPINPINTHLSSRTDSGVHALQSSIHVDLERHDGQPYKVDVMTGVLNRTLDKHDLPIRVNSTRLVPDTFHCRYQAKGRTYLYRLAVAKDEPIGAILKNRNYQNFIPVDEYKRCYFIQDHNFDIEKFKEGANLFKGRHDFRTFMSTASSKQKIDKGPMFSIRSISDIKVYPGRSLAVHPDATRAESLYNYWDLEISGRSFLYKQVRRIVGCLVSLACHRIQLKDVYEMLTIPSKESWHPKCVMAPPFGLYLCKVHYDESDLIFKEAVNETTSQYESTGTTEVQEKQAQAN